MRSLPPWPVQLVAKAEALSPLPLLGEHHPVRAHYVRFLYTAASAALLIHLTAFSLWSLGRSLPQQIVMVPEATRVIDLIPPPPLPGRVAEAPAKQFASAPLEVGVPDPVRDFEATQITMATQDELSRSLPSWDDLPGLDGSGEPVVVRLPEPSKSGPPSPTDFVAVEEQPVVITLPPPVYPELARQAQVDGTVLVLALVGKDGRVKDARIVEGHPMLNEAALDAVRRAIFRPALQQHRPVEVWVSIPMRFVLH